MENDTICAISTPIGTGGISIVRMSGSNALNIAFKIFSSKNVTKDNVKPRYFYLGNINTQDVNEKCMMVYFKAPYSYTGEDLVEFQCHGGVLITQKVLQSLIKNGARIAQGGEFTKRAFVNGKLSLDEAEGVIDVINAESESELKASYGLLKGNLHKEVEKLQNTITDILSEINVTFDFPENDDEEVTSADVLEKLTRAQKILEHIITTSTTGLKLKTGTKVVIVGKPNV
ncbi:MAG: tRNA uridine-5-carboxymethylaminomethyl(34) synthesis GTPase MnmE, partial [Clostridia bacterium]|nr:tRNA uridine-5-carboxymethylaminomethyl(34) synthesis GTPase MnmE [Clostridia bacterium]